MEDFATQGATYLWLLLGVMYTVITSVLSHITPSESSKNILFFHWILERQLCGHTHQVNPLEQEEIGRLLAFQNKLQLYHLRLYLWFELHAYFRNIHSLAEVSWDWSFGDGQVKQSNASGFFLQYLNCRLNPLRSYSKSFAYGTVLKRLSSDITLAKILSATFHLNIMICSRKVHILKVWTAFIFFPLKNPCINNRAIYSL